MCERTMLNDDEWTRCWMKNCFKYGTIGEQMKQIQSEKKWLNPAFENFVNREIIGGRS
jgi:hypothetical protein